MLAGMPRRRDKFKDKEIRSLVETLAETSSLARRGRARRRRGLRAARRAPRQRGSRRRRGVRGRGAGRRASSCAWARWVRSQLGAGRRAAGRNGRPAASSAPSGVSASSCLRALAECEGPSSRSRSCARAEEDWSNAPIMQGGRPFRRCPGRGRRDRRRGRARRARGQPAALVDEILVPRASGRVSRSSLRCRSGAARSSTSPSSRSSAAYSSRKNTPRRRSSAPARSRSTRSRPRSTRRSHAQCCSSATRGRARRR